MARRSAEIGRLHFAPELLTQKPFAVADTEDHGWSSDAAAAARRGRAAGQDDAMRDGITSRPLLMQAIARLSEALKRYLKRRQLDPPLRLQSA